MSHYFTEYIIDNITADNGTNGASFQIPQYAVFCGVWIVDIDACNVGLSICETVAGTFQPVLDPADGADLIICATASDPGFIDFSDFVRCIPSTWYVQLTFSETQAGGPYTHKLFFRG
jgi:hypothetical protein